MSDVSDPGPGQGPPTSAPSRASPEFPEGRTAVGETSKWPPSLPRDWWGHRGPERQVGLGGAQGPERGVGLLQTRVPARASERLAQLVPDRTLRPGWGHGRAWGRGAQGGRLVAPEPVSQAVSRGLFRVGGALSRSTPLSPRPQPPRPTGASRRRRSPPRAARLAPLCTGGRGATVAPGPKPPELRLGGFAPTPRPAPGRAEAEKQKEGGGENAGSRIDKPGEEFSPPSRARGCRRRRGRAGGWGAAREAAIGPRHRGRRALIREVTPPDAGDYHAWSPTCLCGARGEWRKRMWGPGAPS